MVWPLNWEIHCYSLYSSFPIPCNLEHVKNFKLCKVGKINENNRGSHKNLESFVKVGNVEIAHGLGSFSRRNSHCSIIQTNDQASLNWIGLGDYVGLATFSYLPKLI